MSSDSTTTTFAEDGIYPHPERSSTDATKIIVKLVDGTEIERTKRPSGPKSVQRNYVVPADDPFVARFKELDHEVVHEKRGPIPRLKGNYEQWDSYIRDAVAEDANPSLELIAANYQLAAWESHLTIGKVQSFPVSFSVALTDICNARCNFCAYTPERVTAHRISVDSIEITDWLKFVRLFRPNAQLGEPFAHPHVVSVFEAIRERAPFLDLASITNASLFLKPGVIELLVGNFSLLYISVNATSRETYERTMPPLKWDNFVANLTAVRDAKLERETLRPRLDAGYVLYKGNLNDLIALPEFLHRFGFTRVNVKPMMPPPRCSTSDRLLTPDDSIFTEPAWADEVFRETEANAEKFGIEFVRPLPSHDVLVSTNARPDFLKLADMPMD